MRILGAVLLVFTAWFLGGCGPAARMNQASTKVEMEASKLFFETLFKGNATLELAVTNKDAWNVQVIYTKIDRTSANRPRLSTYTFNNSPQYFYPASTIKLPIALLSLEKINDLKNKGLDRNTTMLTEAAYAGQSAVYNDPNTPDGRPTIANYVKKIFLVSDNDASNRLYEFLGQEYINRELQQRGYEEAQILHRLGISHTADENRHTNPQNFYDSSGKLLYSQGLKKNNITYDRRNDFLGKGYYANGKLVDGPMDFSGKNRLALSSLHQMITGLVFPGTVSKQQRFRLSAEERNFALEQMSMFPGESIYPSYDTSTYYDAYTKFIFFGAEKVIVPDNIRIFNKCGNAYGQLIDVAYFCDFKNKVEFIVSAAITCNTDGILNDDKYDYESIGFPFMKNLGQAIYDYELKREKKHLPDLSSFMYRYNK